ncbi:MAG: hypothetical protein ACW981_09380 [Candidatus Hodarchaeales archaeon]|jgi:hypothetical protein
MKNFKLNPKRLIIFDVLTSHGLNIGILELNNQFSDSNINPVPNKRENPILNRIANKWMVEI